MTTFDPEALFTELCSDEGIRYLIYDDANGKVIGPGTVVAGSATIGVGHNVSTTPLSGHIVRAIYDEDLASRLAALDKNAPWWRGMSDARQRALVNLCWMGWGNGRRGLSSMTGFLAFLQAGRWHDAAQDLLQTAYARQVGARAVRLAKLIEEG